MSEEETQNGSSVRETYSWTKKKVSKKTFPASLLKIGSEVSSQPNRLMIYKKLEMY